MNSNEISRSLHEAAKRKSPIAQISLKHPLSLKEAYQIQALTVKHRVSEGSPIVGYKMGFTSRAKMEQMGVHEMIWGRLTQDMLIADGGSLSVSKFIHARVEPEICFKVSKTINRELSMAECKEHVSHVASALEVIDSRYENFKFSLEDVIADNCSSAAFVVGPWLAMKDDLRNLGMKVTVNGKLEAEGNSNAILEDPWNSMQEATRLLTKYGQVIESGSYMMAGAATPARFIASGEEIILNMDVLGEVRFSVVN